MPTFLNLRRTLVLAVLFAIAGPAIPSFAQSRPESQFFDPVAVVDGIQLSRSECAALEKNETAIWVEADGQPACLRYFAAGLKTGPGPNPIAAIWLNGDVLGPGGRNADKRQKGFGPAVMVAQEQRLADRFGVPSIFLGRPGTYGSSGKHYTMRGRPIEADLVNAALDGLSKRYGIQSWALGGHSGGGTIVAELLARRDDVRCAVISSGASAYRTYLEARGLIKPGDKLTRFDPYVSLDKIQADPARRIFIIGDPRETNVPFSSQTLYFEGLVARGHSAWLIPLRRATDERHHDLVDFGETANEMCAAGASTETILATMKTMPEPPPRLTN
ncbi:alpha/beta hydrolase [Kaistia algarum]|uniref:alpha/beta hydrolase family protein n=1 Tax=Kaistia algarum TaxID=2083279 RepID=UPI000CE855F4|nr:alpha/beta hydrolase [Kaistia algarum]MCX5513780.1 alpha/beta hydrolase [Kaistia algarum]PPE79354.1 alpha/beta hydrolase [Kaistia algarum]